MTFLLRFVRRYHGDSFSRRVSTLNLSELAINGLQQAKTGALMSAYVIFVDITAPRCEVQLMSSAHV